MSIDILEGLKSPTLDEDWLKKVVMGGLLSFIPIVNLVVSGYVLRRFRMAAMGEPNLPEWKEWGELFVGGLKLLVVTFVYLFVPILLIMLSAILSATGLGAGGHAASEMLVISGTFVASVLMVVFALFWPMAAARLAMTDSIYEALRVGDIYHRIRMVLGDYLLTYVVYLLVYVVLVIVYVALMTLPQTLFVGVVLSVFVSFYVYLALAGVFGRLYALSEPA